MKSLRVILAVVFSVVMLAGEPARTSGQTIGEVLSSGPDLWGEQALKQPGGPSYAFFEKLLPPLRYVETPFRVYPIVLSAPAAPVKVRLLGDGSVINALARQPNWRGESGIPITIRIGRQNNLFGNDPKRLVGPKLQGGYLPIVQFTYRDGATTYAQETFADVESFSPKHGVAFARFSVIEGEQGKIEAQLDGTEPFDVKEGVARSTDGKVVACFDSRWAFNKARNTLSAFLKKGESAVLAIYTLPGDEPIATIKKDAADALPRIAAERLQRCTDTWNKLLAGGTTIDVPEAIVNNAWRASLIGSYMLLTGDDIRYSHGNQYAKLYIGEGGDAARSFALLGHGEDAARMMAPLFIYTRKALEFHQAAFKLQMLAHHYRLTRDDGWMKANQKLWQKEIDVILGGREKTTGMLPREKYCGDIDTMVYSLNSNSNCWRALRDMSVVLEQTGDTPQAEKLATTAEAYRKIILAELEKAIQRDVSPPFVPIALSGEEKPYEFITEIRMGGYWNIMMQYVIGSGVFKYDSPIMDDFLAYLRQRGGLVMGMLSTHAETDKYWQATRKINDLYGMRYALLLLMRDEPDRALVSFYGKLAQGFTPGTFICCEGSDIRPLDEHGRMMYLPPNSAGNASFLQQLRYLLVQDYDLDDDGREETLRLAFATPRAWLADGQRISVQKAPTCFGDVSFVIESGLKSGRVEAEITLPDRNPPKRTLLRLRLPDGRRVTTAAAGSTDIRVDNETLDLSGLKGTVKIVASVER